MLASVLLHFSGLIGIIIVSVVISLFSSKKKQKKNSFFSQFMSNMSGMPDMSADDASRSSENVSFFDGASAFPNRNAAQPVMSDYVVSEVTDTDSLDSDSLEDDIFEAADPQSVSPIVANDSSDVSSVSAMQDSTVFSSAQDSNSPSPVKAPNDALVSDYSLENLEDAKRAIIYSEILKPKF